MFTGNGMVKAWRRAIGFHGRYGSHTLRNTWGYHQRKDKDAPLLLLMCAYGHVSEAQTLSHLFVQDRELRNLFLGMDL